MDYNRISEEKKNFVGTNEEFIAYANEVVYAYKLFFISVRTVRNMFGAGVAAQIAGAIQQVDPIGYSLFMTPGDDKGTGGGVDIGLAESQGMVDQLVGYGIINSEQGKIIKDLGRVSSLRCNSWECERKITSDDLIIAGRLEQAQALVIALAQDEVRRSNALNARILDASQELPSSIGEI